MSKMSMFDRIKKSAELLRDDVRFQFFNNQNEVRWMTVSMLPDDSFLARVSRAIVPSMTAPASAISAALVSGAETLNFIATGEGVFHKMLPANEGNANPSISAQVQSPLSFKDRLQQQALTLEPEKEDWMFDGVGLKPLTLEQEAANAAAKAEAARFDEVVKRFHAGRLGKPKAG